MDNKPGFAKASPKFVEIEEKEIADEKKAIAENTIFLKEEEVDVAKRDNGNDRNNLEQRESKV